jgi:penicillin-binding protein 1A
MVLSANGKRKNHHQRGKEKLQSLPIKLNFKLETHKDGTATYFREYLRDYKKWAEENKNQMDQIMILQRWSKTTTIDSRMQLHAEEAVSAHMANPRKFSINQRIIKRSFCQHFLCRNQKILNQAMKSSNRWAVMKSYR